MDREHCIAMDVADPLRHLRERFELPEGMVYLDGNSLGPLSVGARRRVQALLDREWGARLVAGWEECGWFEAASRVGERIAHLVGAGPGQVVAADTTSVNLFKLATAGLRLSGRQLVLTEEGNFPTDLYVLDAVARAAGDGYAARRVPPGRALEALDGQVGLLALSHVDYRTGSMHDMAGVTAAAHDAGALVLWDLCHSVGAVPIDLDGCGADLAVGCTYKYLNGGPGSPAFLYAARRLQPHLESPIPGWFSHADPLSFASAYAPAADARRLLTGTSAIVGLAALEGALEMWDEVSIEQVREKSLALSRLMIQLVDERCSGSGLEVATPREDGRRGSQVSLRHPRAGQLVAALAERGVVADFRPPDLVRCGLAAPYVGYTDVWEAVEALHAALEAVAGVGLDSTAG
jgi:kynureninase